jgi:hypothetical protein
MSSVQAMGLKTLPASIDIYILAHLQNNSIVQDSLLFTTLFNPMDIEMYVSTIFGQQVQNFDDGLV